MWLHIVEGHQHADPQPKQDVRKAKKLCMGVKKKRWNPWAHYEDMKKAYPKAKRFYYEVEYDSAMIRFYIERFVAPPGKARH
jgi:hypothetical protein